MAGTSGRGGARPGGGRPSRYRPEYAERAEAWLAQGFSVGALAGELGVSRFTVLGWVKRWPAFAQAVARGRARGLVVWEKRLAEAALSRPGVIQFALRRLSPADWGEAPDAAEVAVLDGGDGTKPTAEMKPLRIITTWVEPPPRPRTGEGGA
ncbi:helix-turn-helix domain-containing protein [Caulobacter sp. 17J65-9]|uniref:helix-turn-helix domain-containing protein n=1 Tax=Caulobacter sp. 17J65-9 TaxID=2709382 RepID=UPI0013C9EE43|nr:helix-turn-helix domain-containing protein [Caulobacter sp. 17J65-9]NEX95357.1 helix-turn-helix domain-containing protein [Caulobacter sp. 17J65-9]